VADRQDPAESDDGASEPPAVHGPVRDTVRLAVVVGALGVVFGDIGTSPIYTLPTVFNPSDPHPVPVSTENVYRVASLIFWSVTIIVTVTYVLLAMRVNNPGEGGIMALITLLRQGSAKLGRRSAVAGAERRWPTASGLDIVGYGRSAQRVERVTFADAVSFWQVTEPPRSWWRPLNAFEMTFEGRLSGRRTRRTPARGSGRVGRWPAGSWRGWSPDCWLRAGCGPSRAASRPRWGTGRR